ncbi:uncharacterized protein EDB93DRAFT_1276132 [Suillus bovinus]|uniref:uncharacterized protein n=1 Tax=Suillus bovinus TaxID=48563 RepID=UPI001B87327E|nr:uncharacterized protein EDB93DRAFT_1276132 [Suillus bovinus]KAG2151206.1 hypothetical protein EDB93DRAFT_1276132 [Suillus bovinus]
MSQASGPGTNDTKDQHTHNEQPPQQDDTTGPINDGTAIRDNCSSNAGPSRLSGPQVQESASNVPLVRGLALANIMKQVLDVLQDSTIVLKTGKDDQSHFWWLYKRLSSSQWSLISVPTPAIPQMPFLKQIVLIGLGNLAKAGSMPADLASTWSPTTPSLWINKIAYASLSMSLLAAFGAVLGKRWLGYYKLERYVCGLEEEQAKCRQKKFNGLVKWHFDAILQSFLVLLQISLLLFGIALGANMWYKQASTAWVITGTTVFGFLFYSPTVMACLISPTCPFQTPISKILQLCIKKVLDLKFKQVSSYFQQLKKSLYGFDPFMTELPNKLLDIVISGWTRLSGVFRVLIHSPGPAHGHSSTKPGNEETQQTQPLSQGLAGGHGTLKLDISDMPISDLNVPSVKWLLETSTDPEVLLAATRLVPEVEWPLGLDISDTLHQLFRIFESCIVQRCIVPSLEEKARACRMALTHLYHGRILQAYSDRGKFIVHGEFIARGKHDEDVFEVLDEGLHITNMKIFQTTKNLCRLVISQLLSPPPPSSPLKQIVANCVILACVMIGVQVDKKDIVRIDKSSALPQLCMPLLTHFQEALGAWGGGKVNILHDHDNPLRIQPEGDDEDSTGVDPDGLWDLQMLLKGQSHSPNNFNWMMNYINDIYSNDRETTYDILFLLGIMGVCCSSPKQPLFIERLINCMDSGMPHKLHNTTLCTAHGAREEIASMDAIDDTMRARDLCYLKLVFALASKPNWHPHLFKDGHISRCFDMTPVYCNTTSMHTICIAGILLQITRGQRSLDSEQWPMIRRAWEHARHIKVFFKPPRGYLKLLHVLVNDTKDRIALESDLEWLIGPVDGLVQRLEPDMQNKRSIQEIEQSIGVEMGEEEKQDLKQGEEIVIAAKELRNMLARESFGQ